jgi:anti-sigma-K factor RskA
MTCEQLRDDYALYALGVADEPEQVELRHHLDRNCPACAEGVRTARGMLSLVGASAPAVAPSSKLRRRILASVGVERRPWAWTPFWIVAAGLSLFVAFYFYGRDRDNTLVFARLQEQARRQSIELAQLNDALALLHQPETRQVIFGEGAPTPARGRVFVHPKLGVLLLAANLPPAPSGKIYEMWLIPKGGQPVPAGLFQSDAEGAAMHLQGAPVDIASTGAVAVTLEPAGGVPEPTTPPLIVATL